MDDDNEFNNEYSPIYRSLLEQAYDVQEPTQMPAIQSSVNQKRALNKARNKLVKSSRFWGKRNDDTFNDDKSSLIFRITNNDGQYRRREHQKLGLPMSSRFWG